MAFLLILSTTSIQGLEFVLVDYEKSVSMVVLDVFEKAPTAKWRAGGPSGWKNIGFGGPDTNSDGFAMYKSNVKLNDGRTYSKILETHPKWEEYGWILGAYEDVYLPLGSATFSAKVGFLQGGEAGDVGISFYLWNEAEHKIEYAVLNTVLSYDDGVKTYSASIPSDYLGKSWTLVLRVNAWGKTGPSSGQDWVSWVYAYVSGQYVLDLTPPIFPVELTQGGSEEAKVSLIGDYPKDVSLSISGLPAGVSAEFSVPSDKAPFTSMLRLTAADDAETGTFTIHVNAKRGSEISVTRTFTLKVEPKAHPDFTLDVSPSSASVSRGGAATYSITVNPLEGFDQPVSLSISGLPAGATHEFSPSSGTPPFTSTLEIKTSATTPLGSHTITITASDGGKTHSESIGLTVEAVPDFSIGVEPPSVTVKQGESAEYVIGVASIEGFSEEVSLSVSGLPSGATLLLSHTSGAPPLKSIMAIQTSEDTPIGSYMIAVTGTGGGKAHSASVELVVEALPSFSITLTEKEVSLIQGESADLAVDIKSSGGFEEVVELSVEGIREGLTATFDPKSDNAPYTSTLTITASKEVSPGTYELMVIGVGGELTRKAPLVVKVKAMPSFEVSISPSSASIVQGEEAEFMVEVKPLEGFSKAVSLSVMNIPSKVSAKFSTSSGTPPFSSTLTITADEEAEVGNYDLALKAEGDEIVKTESFRLSVEEAVEPFDFELVATPSSVEIKPGESMTIAILVNLKSGKAEPVSLTAAGLPSDFGYSFTPLTVTPTGSSTLQLTAGNTPGSYTLVVQASGGGVVKMVNVYVKVEERRCLIATAAFGSELAPQVQVLRGFRDGFVVKTFAGESFMKAFNAFYYSWSPYVAQAEYENPTLRSLVRLSIYPLIYSLEFSRIVAQPFSTAPELAVLISGVVASFLIGFIYISPISVAAALLWRSKFRRFPSLKSRSIILALSLSLTSLMVAEVVSSTALMMVASALTVISCMAMGAISTPLILELILGSEKRP